ncbi:dermatopontin-like [Dysidea avara]|uniref:dermatopontin-like n=1 Tax=Dysidea avara TaxID=196820 RepID=UPI00332FF5AB
MQHCWCTFVVATIAVLVMTEITSSTPCSEFGQRHDFVCASGKPIIHVSGRHVRDNNGKEDRVYCYGCRATSRSTSDCYDTGYVNELDDTLSTQCHPDYYISGVWSERDNGKDRRFAFRCCRVSGLCTRNCYLDGPVNNFDGDMNYNLKAGQVIAGAVQWARKWWFQRCDCVVC